MKIRSIIASLLMAAGSSAHAAGAADLVPTSSADDERLAFSLTSYLWATGLTGKTSTLPPLPAADVDLGFGDLLDDLNLSLMGTGEMRLGRWSFLADVMLSQTTSDGDLPGPFFSSLELRSRSTTLQATALYRVHADDRLNVDLGPGLRYWHLDNRLSIAPGSLNLPIEQTTREDWFDPVIGARAKALLSGPWSVTLIGDVGGFDVSSDFTYQVLGTLNYQWSDRLSFTGGYRLLTVP